MAQYIPKDALVAEIEKLVDKGKYHDEYDCAYRDGNNGALYALKNKLDTLEVKEVDLEEKACDAYCKVCGHYAHSVPTHICRHDCRYFSDFRKYMEGE